MSGHTPSEPVAWRYELAHARVWNEGKPHGWDDWRWHLSEFEPCVPEGAIRNKTPLYSHAANEAKIEVLVKALRAHDSYMLDAGYEGPDSKALHPKAAENWRNIRAALSANTDREG